MNVLALRHVHQRDLWSYHRGQQAAALAASNTGGKRSGSSAVRGVFHSHEETEQG